MTRTRFAALLAAGVFAAGCTDEAGINAQHEIAGELRALRTTLQASERNTQAPGKALDAQAFAAALAPLREVLDALTAQQKDLHTRQLALTQELQRWAHLLAQSVTGSGRAETEALTARLQQLEAAMKEQEARHKETEKLLGGALDRTAEMLEGFLRRLEATVPPNGAGNPPPAPAPDPAVRKTSSLEPATGTDVPPRARRNATAWWLGLLGTAGLAGAVFVWRWRRSAAARIAPAADARVTPDHEAALDPGVQELWAAAAMLGEAVDKLKANQQAAAHDPAPPSLPEGVGAADLFVLDEDPPAAPAAPAPTPAPATVCGAPPTLRCRLPAADPQQAVSQALRTLATDPRVLRRPAPTAIAGSGAIEVTFAVLPDLSPGERSHVEQRVRDAV